MIYKQIDRWFVWFVNTKYWTTEYLHRRTSENMNCGAGVHVCVCVCVDLDAIILYQISRLKTLHRMRVVFDFEPPKYINFNYTSTSKLMT